MGGNPADRTKRNPFFPQPFFKTGLKKSGKFRFGKPQIIIRFIQLINDLGAFGTGEGMGRHPTFETPRQVRADRRRCELNAFALSSHLRLSARTCRGVAR